MYSGTVILKLFEGVYLSKKLVVNIHK